MRVSEFADPSGRFVKNQDGQVTFVPDLLPPNLDYSTMQGLISEAHTSLGVLEGAGSLIPNPDLLIHQYITREAVSSSKIEGTEATNLDVFRFEAEGGVDSGEQKRVQEVINHTRASRSCFEMIGNGERVDMAMLRRAHQILLANVRGQDAVPGHIREVQNWIGYPNQDIENALYVPPAAHLLDGLLSNLMQFVLDPPPGMPVLVQCALAHYQFEAIHPFKDGNGRVGRLLILLILMSGGMLSRPLLYLSSYFERNRAEYYDLLRKVSMKSEWNRWIEFFLRGVIQCSGDVIGVTHRLLNIKSDYERRLRENRASPSAMILATHLFANPVVTIPRAAEYIGMGYPPAKRAVMHLVNAGILEQIGSKRRNKSYLAKDILDAFA